MPLFGNKFSPKKSAPRKWPSLSNISMDRNERASEFGMDYGPIKLKLDGNEMVFDNGQWISEGSGGNQREVQKLKRTKLQLEEENNLLKLKVELLLDMLAQTTAEVHLQENEIDQLKNMSKRKK